MYTIINLMLPTYKRPLKLMSFIDSALRSADDVSRLRFTFCINKKDMESLAYINGRYWPNDKHIDVVIEETLQPNLALYFNMMYNDTKFKDAIVTEVGDDMVFLTRGWDTKILDTINKCNGKVLVYCNDNYIAHDKCCVNLFTTREVVQATGKPFMCEFFHADMIDVVWTMVGAMTNTLCYLPDVIIQHNHSSKQPKENWDETFQRLSPVQQAAGGESNRKLAMVYATYCAKNLIENGIGKWNILG